MRKRNSWGVENRRGAGGTLRGRGEGFYGLASQRQDIARRVRIASPKVRRNWFRGLEAPCYSMVISRGAAPACRILLWAAACLSSLSGHDSAPTDASSRAPSLGILAAKTNMGFRQWRTGPAVVLLRGGGDDERVGGDGAGGDDDGDGARVDADAAALQEECAVPAEQPAPARPKSSYRRSKPLYKIKADGTAEIFSADGTLVEARQPEVCPPSLSSIMSTISRPDNPVKRCSLRLVTTERSRR